MQVAASYLPKLRSLTRFAGNGYNVPMFQRRPDGSYDMIWKAGQQLPVDGSYMDIFAATKTILDDASGQTFTKRAYRFPEEGGGFIITTEEGPVFPVAADGTLQERRDTI